MVDYWIEEKGFKIHLRSRHPLLTFALLAIDTVSEIQERLGLITVFQKMIHVPHLVCHGMPRYQSAMIDVLHLE